jgi:hypothetical protein
MGVLDLSRDVLVPPIAASRYFSLRVSGTNDTASSFVTVVLDTVSKTNVRLEKRQPRLDQAWFWTSEWQAREREADEDLAAGRYDDFETIDDFIENLETLMGEQ